MTIRGPVAPKKFALQILQNKTNVKNFRPKKLITAETRNFHHNKTLNGIQQISLPFQKYLQCIFYFPCLSGSPEGCWRILAEGN